MAAEHDIKTDGLNVLRLLAELRAEQEYKCRSHDWETIRAADGVDVLLECTQCGIIRSRPECSGVAA